MFADTHCHPLMKYLHKDREDDLWKPFTGGLDLAGIVNMFVGIPAFSQADMKTLAKGNVQIVFCALHPPEQKIMFHALKDSGGEGMLEKVAAQAISIPKGKIDNFQETEYDHWQLLNGELKILTDNENTTSSANGKTVGYKITRNFEEVKAILDFNRKNKNERTIAIIPTVEGLHALGCGHIEFSGPNPFNVSEETFMKRVDMIKGVSGIEGSWNFPPLIANITHAFDNGLCGHAQALSQLFQLLFSYAEPYGPPLGPLTYEGLYKGLSPFGEKVILRMLNLDEVSKSRSNPGRRIIPDLKHMSTQTRKRYYEILDNHNTSSAADDKIPVIMSHAAVNGHSKMGDYLEPKDLRKIDSHKAWEERETFNPSGLNLFNDEILRIHITKGLIGIIMDQRVLAGGQKLKALKGKIDNDDDMEVYFKGKNRKRKWATLVLDQIEYIIRRVKDSGRSDWREAWNIICIGSDFDGQIDPIDAFKKSTDFKDLRRVLRKLIKRDDRFDDLLNGVSTELVLDKISSDNVFNFLRRNF